MSALTTISTPPVTSEATTPTKPAVSASKDYWIAPLKSWVWQKLSSATLEDKIKDFYDRHTPISFETGDIFFRSVLTQDITHFRALFVDPKVMEKMTDHQARFEKESSEEWEKNQIQKADARVAELVLRWALKNPLSGFVMFRKSTGEFVGHVVAGYSGIPGRAEVAYMIPQSKWHQGYGTEGARFILKYLAALIQVHNKWIGKPLMIEGLPLTEAVAISRADNIYSELIARGMGMTFSQKIKKWNKPQMVYQFPFDPLRARL